MEQVIIVGMNSFIAKNLYKSYQLNNPYKKVSLLDSRNKDALDVILDPANIPMGQTTIINASITEEYKTQQYSEKNDMDLFLAKKARDCRAHYIMLSSRKVYGNNPEVIPYTENSKLLPFDNYSDNKVITEEKIRSMSSKHTILRMSNIVGYEPGRKSFMGYCIDQIRRTGDLNLTLARHLVRDFLDIDTTCELLYRVIAKKPMGTFNFSSNQPCTVGDVAQWLVDGVNSKLTNLSRERRAQVRGVIGDRAEQFILVNKKLLEALNVTMTPIHYQEVFRNIGRCI